MGADAVRARRTARRHRLAIEVIAALALKLLALFVLYELFFDEDARPVVERADIYTDPPPRPGGAHPL